MNVNLPELFCLTEVSAMTKLARSTLNDIQNPKSPRFDSTFPEKVKLSLRAVRYSRKDVINWLESRKVSSLKSKEVTK